MQKRPSEEYCSVEIAGMVAAVSWRCGDDTDAHGKAMMGLGQRPGAREGGGRDPREGEADSTKIVQDIRGGLHDGNVQALPW